MLTLPPHLLLLAAMAVLPAAWLPSARAAVGAAVGAAEPSAVPAPQRAQPVNLESGNGRVLTLESGAANVFVADPKVAEVRPASANTLFVFGVGPGRTTVAAMDSGGHVLAQFDVTVRQSGFAAGQAETTIARLIPNSRIGVMPLAKGLLLTGNAASPAEAARAVAIARGFLADGQAIENQLAVGSQVQVALRVRIAEMQRSVTRALGINWQALGTIGRSAALGAGGAGTVLGAFSSTIPLSSFTLPATGTLRVGSQDFNALIDALAQENLAHLLAEPNLTTMSGESASFLAGGEFPIPVSEQNNTVSISFKKFGVALAFVPTVLSDGRINLHVSPEVSELTDTGSVKLSAGNSSISIPALKVRRAETTVELGSGQSFAIAGLLQDSVAQGANGLPGLGDIPVLGALFRSTSFQRNESELVILVTPYVVRPVSDPGALGLPTDGAQPASDLERILRLRQIARQDPAVPARIPGQAGFIVQ